MDAYIRNELTVSNDLTLQLAATHSGKLLLWLLDCEQQMQMEQQQQPAQRVLELGYADVECLFKATLYLHECYARHGEELVETLLLQFPGSQAAIRQFYANCCEGQSEQSIRELCGHIVNGTRNGHTLAPLLYQMHKAYGAVQPAWNVMKELNWSAIVPTQCNETLDAATAMEHNREALQMRCLVRRIFRLASMEQIQTAIQRAMGCIAYDLWLQLFREPKESILYTRCYIVRQMICDMLTEGISAASSNAATASARFVHHIYGFVANGRGCNVSRLLRSLLHQRFARALGSFLLSYWTQQLPHLQLDDMELDEAAPIQLQLVELDEMLFLTHLLLTPKSPCRSQFYADLRTLPTLKSLLELLNKVAYVYSYS